MRLRVEIPKRDSRAAAPSSYSRTTQSSPSRSARTLRMRPTRAPFTSRTSLPTRSWRRTSSSSFAASREMADDVPAQPDLPIVGRRLLRPEVDPDLLHLRPGDPVARGPADAPTDAEPFSQLLIRGWMRRASTTKPSSNASTRAPTRESVSGRKGKPRRSSASLRSPSLLLCPACLPPFACSRPRQGAVANPGPEYFFVPGMPCLAP